MNTEKIPGLEYLFSSLLLNLQNNLCFTLDEEVRKCTPNRLAKMYSNELLMGYKQDPKTILSKRFKSNSNDMIIIKDIEFVSLCAHHWLPFIGHMHFGYIPNKKEIVGLSKIPRLVNCFARRFQVQENLTSEIVDAFYNIVKPKGCIVISEAQHLCAQIRGVQNKEAKMKVSAIRGCFNNDKIRSEFLKLM